MKSMYLVPAALLAAAVAGCTHGETPKGPAGPAVPVSVAAAAEQDLATPFEAGGVIRAQRVAVIVSRIMADVRAVPVKAGDRVRTGQALVLPEMAQLFEVYFQETRGLAPRQGQAGPSVHRVLPVGEAVAAQLDILPYQRAVDLVNQAQAWAVRRCICRVQRGLIGQGCEHTVENCLSWAPVPGYFDGRPHVRALTREEALEVLRAAAAEGLVQTTSNVSGDSHYICNCCACCCGVLRAAKEFHSPAAVANSGLQAQVDAALCIGCGQCVERCPMEALSLPDDVSMVETQRCIGCGLCVMVCPAGALSLAPRPEAERIAPPKDMLEWMTQRARERGIPLEEVL